MTCHHGFKLKGSVCNSCHDLTMLRFNISNIAVITIKAVDYFCIIQEINICHAIIILESSTLDDCCYIMKFTPRKLI